MDLTAATQRTFDHHAGATALHAAAYGEAEIIEPAARPSTADDRGANPLRPRYLDEMIGQPKLRGVLRRVIDRALHRGRPLGHVLLIGGSGTGKSTLSNIIANELGADVYQVEAPVSQATLLELREVMKDGDVLFIDEIHQQAASVRGAKDATTTPEVLFSVMEDRAIVSNTGVLPFPHVTVIGATTDEGLLPDPFVMRFPLKPVIDPYVEADMALLAKANARALGLTIDDVAAARFALACRLTPRVLNSYVRNADDLCSNGHIDEACALEVIGELNSTTWDGLDSSMQKMLKFLATQRHETRDGHVSYHASLPTIATGIGKGRDAKAVQLRVEGWLVQQGYVLITNRGRQLTELGLARAGEL